MEPRFKDRSDAGRVLADRLSGYADDPSILVLALPRGGVPVGVEIARALDAPMDVYIVRKLGVPGHEELAMGAIATGGVRVINNDVIRSLDITEGSIASVAAQEQKELERRQQIYRGEAPAPDLRGRTVVLVDDGLATGSTMRAAVTAVKEQGPARIVVAVPTASPNVCDEIGAEVDEIMCAITPEPMYGVGAWYEDFSQLTDDDVRRFLEEMKTAS